MELSTFVTAFVRRYLGGRLALDVQHDLRQQVFGAVQRLDGAKQDTLRTGQVVSRSITDLQLVQGLLMMVPLSIGTVVFALAALGAMLWLSPMLTLIALVITPVVAVVAVRSRRVLFPASWSAQQRAADLAQHVEETVTGVRVVKGFGQEAREISRLDRAARTLFGERMRTASADLAAGGHARGDAGGRAGRGARARRLHGAERAGHARHVPRVRELRGQPGRARPGCCPACWSTCSWRGPAWSGCTS